MAGGMYNVYLADVLGCVSADFKLKISTTLQGFFGDVVALAGSGFTSATVQWIASFPSVTPQELLVYFVPNQAQSIMAAAGRKPTPGADGGTFVAATGTVSEVYAGSSPGAALLARLAFHELMHNKMQMSDGQLHPRGGLAAATVTDSTDCTDQNKGDMAAALQKSVPQWTTGITILSQGSSDPLSPYYHI
jgi:hypothetical protein